VTVVSARRKRPSADITTLRSEVRQALEFRQPAARKEDQVTKHLKTALGRLGRFCRTVDSIALFFHTTDRKLYEISDRPKSPFGQLVTYLVDLSVTNPVMRRGLDRLRAWVLGKRTSSRYTGSHATALTPT